MSEMVTSQDGTRIACARTGSGPALVTVAPVMASREQWPSQDLVDLLAEHFTVISYDRRGKGDSTDTQPWAVDREIEDIAALIAEVGGEATVFGFSSGGVLALRAALAGNGITKVVVVEPPLEVPDLRDDLREQLKIDPAAAIGQFRTDVVGVPAEVAAQFPITDADIEAAPTMLYDLTFTIESETAAFGEIKVPTLIIASEGSDERLLGWARDLEATIPGATLRTLAGDWHGVPDATLAEAIVGFAGLGVFRDLNN